MERTSVEQVVAPIRTSGYRPSIKKDRGATRLLVGLGLKEGAFVRWIVNAVLYDLLETSGWNSLSRVMCTLWIKERTRRDVITAFSEVRTALLVSGVILPRLVDLINDS